MHFNLGKYLQDNDEDKRKATIKMHAVIGSCGGMATANTNDSNRN